MPASGRMAKWLSPTLGPVDGLARLGDEKYYTYCNLKSLLLALLPGALRNR